jgi:type IV secretory pathway VirB4 component
MLRLDKIIKPWKEAAALCDHINLYGFWNETAFLTKSGDLGMVLCVPGVDYESLDHSEQEYAVKRLEAALKSFGPGFHVYQYLFKTSRPEIPFADYDDAVVQTAIDRRRQFFEEKADRLYQIEIYYCVLLEGSRSKTGMGAAFARLFHDPAGAANEFKTQCQMVIRKAETSKKVHLNVDAVSYWIATNSANDNLKKRDYFARFGIADGLRRLAQDFPFRPRTLTGISPKGVAA